LVFCVIFDSIKHFECGATSTESCKRDVFETWSSTNPLGLRVVFVCGTAWYWTGSVWQFAA